MNSLFLYCGQIAVSLHSYHTSIRMKKVILSILVLMLPVMGLQAQIINKRNKDKISQDIKDGFKTAMDAIKQDTKPSGEHNQWDGYVAPRVGIGVASLPGAGGRPEAAYLFGTYIEAFVTTNLGISFGMDYQHQGANSVRSSVEVPVTDANGKVTGTTVASGKYDYNLNYVNTSYLIHWYPWPYRAVSFYTGLQISRLMTAKAKLHGGSKAEINDEIHEGEINFPIGASYEWKQWEFDVRYFISPRELASSHKAKNILGNARNMMLSVSVAYRIKIF